MYSLDIETAPIQATDKPFALEPYRVLTGESEITAVSAWGPKGLVACLNHKNPDFRSQVIDLLELLEGKEVYCTNTIFDVSFLIAFVGPDRLRHIKWRDTAILNKWLVNGQKADRLKLSYSLANSAKRYLKDWPKLEEFIDVKKQKITAGENFEYWLDRNKLDVEATYLIAKYLEGHLHKRDNYRGYIIACNSIFPIAEGYVVGIPVDMGEVIKYKETLELRQLELLDELRIEGSVITSPKQLARLLFDDWKLTPQGLTPKGAPSTSAENLLRLHQIYAKDRPELNLIMEYKTCATMLSKYVKGFENSTNYLSQDKIHGQPRLLSTITGRMTYTTKFFKKQAWQTSIALHQLPRKDKNVKRCMKAPAGYKVLYMDFGAQEGRVMAIEAPEPTMIESYSEGVDLHSDLTEEIFGTPYADIVKANMNGKPEEIVEQRQAGKLTGLSSFYRIGAKALAGKFFATYGYDISIQTAQSYLSSFKRKYPGVVKYWKNAISLGKSRGYASAFGGWRYAIESFGWKGESSAINHPIQGGGSMLTYAAIGVINKGWPDLILVSQVHDSIAYFIPEENADAIGKDVIEYMNHYDYGKLLGFEQTVPLIFDGGIGDNFADIRSL